MHSHDTIIYVGSWEDFTASFPCPLSEPDEIQKQNSNNLRQIYEKSRGSSLINSSRQFSIQSSILRNSQTSSRPTHIVTDREVPYLKLGSRQSPQKENMFVNPLGLWSILLKIQDEVIVRLLHQGL
jgi:hypothetical protein